MRASGRLGIGLAEVLIGLVLIVVLGMPALNLGLASTRRTSWERERLFLVGHLQKNMTQSMALSWDALEAESLLEESELPGDQGEEIGISRLRSTRKVASLTPGLMEIILKLEWVDSRGSPRTLERRRLKARSTRSLEARSPES